MAANQKKTIHVFINRLKEIKIVEQGKPMPSDCIRMVTLDQPENADEATILRILHVGMALAESYREHFSSSLQP